MRFLKLYSFLFLIFFSVQATALTGEELFEHYLRAIRQMTADFTQTVVGSGEKGNATTSGKMALRRPGKFMWDTLQPTKQLVTTDGEKVWIYDPDLEQVVIKNANGQFKNTPAKLLLDRKLTIKTQYSVVMKKKTGDLRWFILKPLDPSHMFTEIKIGFNKDRQVAEMILLDQLGNTTNIAFFKIDTKTKLDEDSFAFKPPRNIDVIDETKDR